MLVPSVVIEALQASRSALLDSAEELKALREQNSDLQAAADIQGQVIARLQSDLIKIVEPEAVQPLLDDLARSVAALHEVIAAPDADRSNSDHLEVFEALQNASKAIDTAELAKTVAAAPGAAVEARLFKRRRSHSLLTLLGRWGRKPAGESATT